MADLQDDPTALDAAIWALTAEGALRALGIPGDMRVSELREAVACWERLKGCPDGWMAAAPPLRSTGEVEAWAAGFNAAIRWVRGEDIENGDDRGS